MAILEHFWWKCSKKPLGFYFETKDDLNQICLEFYPKLYLQETSSLESTDNRDMILDCVSSKFSPEMSLQLQHPLSKEELHMALLNMAKGHTLGPDGGSTEFFCRF